MLYLHIQLSEHVTPKSQRFVISDDPDVGTGGDENNVGSDGRNEAAGRDGVPFSNAITTC